MPGEWAVREEWAVRGVVGEPAGIALATVMFQVAPGVEIGVPSVAAAIAAVVAPGPAAAGDPPAWEVPVVLGAAAGGEGRQSNPMTGAKHMIRKISNTVTHALLLASFASFAAVVSQGAPQSGQKVASAVQESFATPQEAAEVLIKAAGDYDVPALLKIFGPSGEDFISSADPVRDKNTALAFADLARSKHSVVIDRAKPDRATLVVGDQDWPLPVPLVKENGKWFFDSKAGHDEILYRRIGANELDAIQICHGYVEAQYEYALKPREGYSVNQYAQRVISTPGKQDGLAWQNPDGTWGGPVGEKIARAIAQGYSSRSEPYHGYFFKILKGQGPAAPLGRLDYVIKGVMIGGFALAAVPAEYRVTGVKTFMVSNDGIVYEKDLGPDSLNIFKNMELYNPDKTWHRTDDQWPEGVSEPDVAGATP